MKKLLSMGITLILLFGTLFGLTGCKIVDRKTGFYNEKTLVECSVENLPKPDFKYKGDDSMNRRINGNISEENFYEYAQRLFAYMNEKFEYLGTGGGYLGRPDVWGTPMRYIACERELENYRSETRTKDGTVEGVRYLFVYFIKDPFEEYTKYETTWKVEIDYWPTEQTYRVKEDEEYKDKYTYNFSIKLRKYGAADGYLYVDKYLEAGYEKQYPDCGEASVLHYYESVRKDMYFVMMSGSNEEYTEEAWTETLGENVFHYPNGNRILITYNYYNPVFYTLTEMYEKGWIDDSELANLEAQHRKFYPELYIEAEEN